MKKGIRYFLHAFMLELEATEPMLMAEVERNLSVMHARSVAALAACPSSEHLKTQLTFLNSQSEGIKQLHSNHARALENARGELIQVTREWITLVGDAQVANSVEYFRRLVSEATGRRNQAKGMLDAAENSRQYDIETLARLDAEDTALSTEFVEFQHTRAEQTARERELRAAIEADQVEARAAAPPPPLLTVFHFRTDDPIIPPGRPEPIKTDLYVTLAQALAVVDGEIAATDRRVKEISTRRSQIIGTCARLQTKIGGSLEHYVPNARVGSMGRAQTVGDLRSQVAGLDANVDNLTRALEKAITRLNELGDVPEHNEPPQAPATGPMTLTIPGDTSRSIFSTQAISQNSSEPRGWFGRRSSTVATLTAPVVVTDSLLMDSAQLDTLDSFSQSMMAWGGQSCPVCQSPMIKSGKQWRCKADPSHFVCPMCKGAMVEDKSLLPPFGKTLQCQVDKNHFALSIN
jgi:hypothetical protein